MRKFTSLMLMLLCAVTTTWAQTELPELTTDEANPVWYTISNTRSTSGKYLYWTGDAAEIQDANSISPASFFYFTGEEADGVLTVKIHNYATSNLFAANNSWTETGTDVTIGVTPHSSAAGLYIGFKDTYLNERNSNSGYTTYKADDAGSIFVFEKATDFVTLFDIPAVKNAAIAEIQLLATATAIYPATAETEAAINAVTPAGTGIAELSAAFEEIKALVAAYKTNAYQALEGKYFSIKTPARTNGYLEMGVSQVSGVASLASPAAAWKFVENNGKVNIYNEYTKKYLCEPAGNSVTVAVTSDQASAGAYDLLVSSTDSDSDGAVIKLTSNSKSTHLDGSGNLVRWDNGGASEFIISELKNDDFASIATAYKTTVLATIEDWATLTVVFDAALIADAKTAINAVTSTGFEACAAYDAELKKVTDAVAAKMFTFQTTATDNNRNGVWVSANASTMKAIGADTQDYNAIWSLRHAAGKSFYMYNELTSLYMGAPAGECALTAEPVAAYSFEIVDAANSIVEMKSNGGTLHASNWDANQLINYDGDEDASRWYIRTIDVAADIQTIIDGLTEADYAEVPALGQYTKAAYDALVEARTSARTVAEVEAAIAAFDAAKNRPVFTIDGVIDYAAGKSIYDDSDAAPNFKATNKYDKTMWWVFDQTTTTVGVTESVAVKNYATRNGFWGAEALKIAETSDAVEGNDDGIFLFYTVGSGTTLHYQNASQVIVRYNATEANSGSATKFTYLGNTYDLDKLTDEHIIALSALQAAYDNNASFAKAVIGEELGQYKGSKDEIVAAEAAAKAILEASVAEQAAKEVAAIEAAATALNEGAANLTINMPVAGKYYRIQGACEASLKGYYITGHTNWDGGRIALTENADASTIYYFDGTNLIAYESGLVVGLNANHWTFASIDDNSKPASTITFAQSPRTVGAYTVKSADRYFHYTVYNGTVQVNRCAEDTDKEHDWYLTEVTELPVSISAAGYATFFAPVAVEVAEGVTAHTVTVDGEWAVLNEIEGGVVPANTGVILTAEAETYNFAVTTADAFKGTNLMAGTVAKTLVTKENAECYVLAKPADAESAGLYVAKMGDDTTKFYNAGHKAYLVVANANPAAQYSFRFGEGTTGIENVESAEAVKAIFDLTGRRVEVVTAPGIYIVNGKKVLVK